MKLLFSEAKPDYSHYLFPYAVWAMPETHERPSDLFDAGFLPATKELNRFYLCRHVRVDLARFKPSSENRRILRKGDNIGFQVIPRARFPFSDEQQRNWKHFADIRFGKDVMSHQRLEGLMHSPIITDIMVFTDESARREVGSVTLYLEPPRLAYFYYSFYDLNYYERNLGMFMMTSAVAHFASLGFSHLYLGTVYSKSALYKTQFAGAEFFNGFAWSDDIKQLKHLLLRDAQTQSHHLLESDLFLESFYPDGLAAIIEDHGFSASTPQVTHARARKP